MVNQAFRIKIACRSQKKEEEKEEKKKIPGIDWYPMGPTIKPALRMNGGESGPPKELS